MKLLQNNKAKIFLTVFLVYLFYLSPEYLPAFTTRNIILTKAIVDDKTFSVDKYYTKTRDIAPFGGHKYIGGAPGTSFIAVPFYLALKPVLGMIANSKYSDLDYNLMNIWLTLFLSLLPGGLIAVLLYSLFTSFGVSEGKKVITVFTCSFGTMLFYYSTRFSYHVLGAFLLLLAFWILYNFREIPKKGMFFIAGLCLGNAVLVDYQLIGAAVLMPLYSIINFKQKKVPDYILLISAEFVLALVYFYYHYQCFSNPLVPGSAYNRVGPHMYKQMGLHTLVAFPSAEMVIRLLFGGYVGLFLYNPILLISVIGILVCLKNQKKKYIIEAMFIALIAILIFVNYANFCMPLWANQNPGPLGGTYGPRHLLAFIPLLFIFTPFAYKILNYNVLKWVGIISILVNWCGVQYGDADNVFTDIGLFIFRGLNSGLAEWLYRLTNAYMRELNVVTHFSPLIGLIALLAVIYFIWKKEINGLFQNYFCRRYKIT